MTFRIIHHPRIHNKSFRCQSGLHKWQTASIGGIPHLTCSKCGAVIAKAIHEGQATGRDYRKLTGVGKTKPKTNKEIIEEAWEAHQKKKRPKR